MYIKLNIYIKKKLDCMKTYYKNENHSTSFNDENGELLNIFNQNGSLTLTIQAIEESQRELMVTNLGINNGASTEAEFKVVLTAVKSKVKSL